MRQQIVELTSVHTDLTNIVEGDYGVILSGSLPFEASSDGLETITESFEIELTIPHEFPDALPQAKETAGRIEAEYDHRNPGGTLCLAVPVEQRRIFLEQPTLLGFVDRLLIPYLYGYCFWRIHGRHPFGEAAHGHQGILLHYMAVLSLKDEVAALAAICFLFERGYRGHHDCPCRSGLRVRACHGPALLALHQSHSPETLRSDFMAIFELCFAKFQDGQLSFPEELGIQLVRILDTLSR